MEHNKLKFINKEDLLQNLSQNGYQEVVKILKDKNIDAYKITDPNFEQEINDWNLNPFQRMTLRNFAKSLRDNPGIINISTHSHCNPRGKVVPKCPFKPDVPVKSVHLRAKLDTPPILNKSKDKPESKEKPPIHPYPKNKPVPLSQKCQIITEDLKLHLQNKLGDAALSVGQSNTAPNLHRPPALPRRNNESKLLPHHIKLDENFKRLPNPQPFKMNERFSGSSNNLSNLTSEPLIPRKPTVLKQQENFSTFMTMPSKFRDSDCSYITDEDITASSDPRTKSPLPEPTRKISPIAKNVHPPVVPEFKHLIKPIGNASSLNELRVSENPRKISKEHDSSFWSVPSPPISHVSPVAGRKPQLLPREDENDVVLTDEELEHDYEDPKIILSQLNLDVKTTKEPETGANENDNLYENVEHRENTNSSSKEAKSAGLTLRFKKGLSSLFTKAPNKTVDSMIIYQNFDTADVQVTTPSVEEKIFNRPLPAIPKEAEDESIDCEVPNHSDMDVEHQIEEEDNYERMNFPQKSKSNDYSNKPPETSVSFKNDLANELRINLLKREREKIGKYEKVVPLPPLIRKSSTGTTNKNSRRMSYRLSTPLSTDEEFDTDEETDAFYNNINPDVDPEDDGIYCQTVTRIIDIESSRFFRDTNRTGAREFLRDQDDGAFVLRRSGTHSFAITIKYGKYKPNKCYDLGIEKTSRNKIKLIAEDDNATPEFSSVQAFVDYFSKQPVTFEAGDKFIEVYLKPKSLNQSN